MSQQNEITDIEFARLHALVDNQLLNSLSAFTPQKNDNKPNFIECQSSDSDNDDAGSDADDLSKYVDKMISSANDKSDEFVHDYKCLESYNFTFDESFDSKTCKPDELTVFSCIDKTSQNNIYVIVNDKLNNGSTIKSNQNVVSPDCETVNVLLDINTVLYDKNGIPIGLIKDILGPVNFPMYECVFKQQLNVGSTIFIKKTISCFDLNKNINDCLSDNDTIDVSSDSDNELATTDC